MLDFFRYGLFSPPMLSYDPLFLLLNHSDVDERDRLTEKWKDNKLQENGFIGVVVRGDSCTVSMLHVGLCLS